jgi:RND family efflux transporter MFP subunit
LHNLDDTIVEMQSVERPVVKRPRRLWAVFALITGLIVGIGTGWWLAKRQEHEADKIALGPISHATDASETKVTAAPVVYRSHQRFVDAVGSVNGYESVTLSARADGRVQNVYHDLADQVASGDLLLKIDPTDASLAVIQAKRALDAELAKWGFKSIPREGEDLSHLPTVRSAQLKAELAQSKLQRWQSVENRNVVSQEDLDQAKSDAQVAVAEWNNHRLLAEGAAATVRLKEAELQIAQQKLAETDVFVPTPTLLASQKDNFYTIAERLVSEGMLVRNGDPMFRLILGRTVKVRLELLESYSNTIAVGQTVHIETSSLDNYVVGKIMRISPVVDSESRTLQVEAEVPNEDMRLKPGSFVKAKILVGDNAQTIATIPITGLDTFAGVNKIFLLENGVAHEVKVKLGYQGTGWVEIVNPKLPENAIIATSAQRLLSEGSHVTIRTNSPTENAASIEKDNTPAVLETAQ